MGDLFREIDEELRQERAEKLWRKYGRYVIGFAVAVVVAVAAYTWWEKYKTDQRLEEGAKFAAAKEQLRAGKTKEAAASFASLAERSGTAYGALARFHRAALRAKAGDTAGAISVYESLVSDASLDRPLRDLALVLAALHSLNGPRDSAAALVARLEPLTEAGSPWRFSALEIVAIHAHRNGDLAKARTNYQAIVDDIEALQNIRARATQMLAVLGK